MEENTDEGRVVPMEKVGGKRSYLRFNYTLEQQQHAIDVASYGQSHGPPSVLNNEEEGRLEACIIGKARLGFPIHPSEVQDTVQKVVRDAEKQNPLDNNLDETGVSTCPKSGKVLWPKKYFRPLKNSWRIVIRMLKQNTGKSISKVNFCVLFKEAFTSVTPEVIRNGFKGCGISPYHPNNVDYIKCVSKRPEDLANEKKDVTLNEYRTELKVFEHEIVDRKPVALEHKMMFSVWKIVKNKKPKKVKHKSTDSDERTIINGSEEDGRIQDSHISEEASLNDDTVLPQMAINSDKKVTEGRVEEDVVLMEEEEKE
ncbi:hypothetical protein J6590_053597 [Homalodisca vitripennis]|nr:hypothetical protein J6590_053597 [Homalodisca vitripennis]